MRMRHRMWRNGPGGRWTVRLIWYHEAPGVNIRLEIRDRGRESNFYPATLEEAEAIWAKAQELADGGPFTAKLNEFVSTIHPSITI